MKPPEDRFLLWIDAVGGFLVCLGDRVSVGQAVPGNNVDIPIQADISRRHFSIQRQQESYVLVPGRPVRLAGEPLDEPGLLRDGSLIEPGGNARLKFFQPHPLSATARLELAGRHRTQPPVDAVLLMADTCVIGPSVSCHVRARDFRQEVILFRQRGKLMVRTAGDFEVDGKSQKGSTTIQYDSRIRGKDFAIALERL